MREALILGKAFFQYRPRAREKLTTNRPCSLEAAPPGSGGARAPINLLRFCVEGGQGAVCRASAVSCRNQGVIWFEFFRSTSFFAFLNQVCKFWRTNGFVSSVAISADGARKENCEDLGRAALPPARPCIRDGAPPPPRRRLPRQGARIGDCEADRRAD